MFSYQVEGTQIYCYVYSPPIVQIFMNFLICTCTECLKKRGAKNITWHSTSQCTYYEMPIIYCSPNNKKLIRV